MRLDLDTFPAVLLRRLPSLDEDGFLPPGDYGPAAEDFERQFVNNTPRRVKIYDGWNRHRQALLDDALKAGARQLLNGSFTTSKPDPGDIDLAVEVPMTSKQLQGAGPDSPVVRLLMGPAMKDLYHCDAYPIYCLPADDPNHEQVTIGAIRYWTKWFGRARDGRPKGRVWAFVGGFR
ncbi:MAG TPA: hypothetical protein VE685_14460 [Thermoanaerobaculia bacterium]|nr:hypothetical protein [Thermoanaerobaculia bacterium]